MNCAEHRGAAVALTCIAVLASGCGGDSGTGPSRPASGSQQVPRVLALSTVDGAPPPGPLYDLSDGTPVSAYDGSATLQADSMLAVRVTSGVDRGTDTFTTAGVLDGTGHATFNYIDGSSDHAQVNADGSIDASLSITVGVAVHTARYHFASAYTGPALNPIPRITAIVPVQARAYGLDSTLVLIGSSFMPTTTVMWGTSALKVTYESDHRISAPIPVTGAGTMQLVVSNPGPGGGERIYRYNVVLPPPVLTSLSPATVPAGGGDFDLHIHGNYFPSSTTVLWNGVQRAVGHRGVQDLVISVPGTDIQSAGTVQITVQTGGGSAALPLTVTGTPAQKLAEMDTHFDPGALVADPVRPLVYASAGMSEQTYPHSIVAIDPVAGTIAWTRSLPKDILSLAISDDGQYLYAGERGAPTVVRVALATHTVDMTITLSDAASQPGALAVMPGHAHTFAVVRACHCSPVTGPLFVYDDSIARPNSAPAGPAVLAALGPNAVYGVEAFGDGVFTYTIDPSGVIRTVRAVTTVAGPYTFVGSRLYAAGGGVYDLATNAFSTYSTTGRLGAVLPSTDGTRLYEIDAGQSLTQSYVRVADPATGAELGAVPVNVGANGSGDAFRWGSDGIVYAGSGAVVFVRADFVH